MKNKYVIGLIAIVLVSAGYIFITKQGQKSDTSQTTTDTGLHKFYPVNTITHGHGLAVDAAESSKVYIATHHGLLVLVNDEDLYTVGTSKDDYMGFSPNPKDAKVFFSSGHPESGGDIGFQKSIDGGFTWKKVSDGLDGPVDFHALTVSPLNPDLVFGWYQGNLQRSTDGGKNWKKFATNFVVVRLIADPNNENGVYAASPQGLFLSSNKGESWQKVLDGFVATLAINPKDTKTMIVASEKIGLAKSIDEGKTWIAIKQNFYNESPLFIAFDPQKTDTVYLLTEKNSLYKSVDGGENWKKIR